MFEIPTILSIAVSALAVGTPLFWLAMRNPQTYRWLWATVTVVGIFAFCMAAAWNEGRQALRRAVIDMVPAEFHQRIVDAAGSGQITILDSALYIALPLAFVGLINFVAEMVRAENEKRANPKN